MKKKLSLKQIFQGKIIRLGIKEIISSTEWQKQLSKIDVRLIKRIPFPALKKNTPTIAIVTPPALSQLCPGRETLCCQMLDNVFKNNRVFLIIAKSLSIPDFLKKLIATNDISIAASKYDEHYLRSLLKELIREKCQETISVHGVVLEAEGKGVLITGASGIGKTTAALETVTKDYYWVADDIVVIKKNKQGQLIASGHKKISNYLHTEATGIIPVASLLKPDRIKVNTILAAVVEVEKAAGTSDIRVIKGEKEILGVKLIYFHIDIPSTGYFNENLLKKTVRQLPMDN